MYGINAFSVQSSDGKLLSGADRFIPPWNVMNGMKSRSRMRVYVLSTATKACKFTCNFYCSQYMYRESKDRNKDQNLTKIDHKAAVS